VPLNGPPSTEMWVSVGPRLYGSLPAQSVCWWAWPESPLATAKNFGKPAKPEATLRWLFPYESKHLGWIPGGFQVDYGVQAEAAP